MFCLSEGNAVNYKDSMYFERCDAKDYNKYCFDGIQASLTPMSPNVHFTFPYHKTHVIYIVNMYDYYV